VSVSFNFDPSPGAGPGRIRFALTDAQGQQIEGARVRLEGHMTHPGMVPVVSNAAEVRPGIYEARPQFTMAGQWTFVVSGSLADGTPITARRQQIAPRVTVHEDMVRREPDSRGAP
jgi:hypothetical protein